SAGRHVRGGRVRCDLRPRLVGHRGRVVRRQAERARSGVGWQHGGRGRSTRLGERRRLAGLIMYRLELKVPPPVVALCLAFLMWFAPSLGQPEVPLQVRVGMALVLVLIGQSISIAGMVAFRRARPTLNPTKAS